ncbi:MAG: transposase [Candidatus Limnocylindria bacterium]
MPRVRDGSYLPSLLDPRRRTERALLAVIQEAYHRVPDERRSSRRNGHTNVATRALPMVAS